MVLLPAKVGDEVGEALACVGAVVALNHGAPVGIRHWARLCRSPSAGTDL